MAGEITFSVSVAQKSLNLNCRSGGRRDRFLRLRCSEILEPELPIRRQARSFSPSPLLDRMEFVASDRSLSLREKDLHPCDSHRYSPRRKALPRMQGA
ncbi:unnamed protein product [Victoria cruziana]